MGHGADELGPGLLHLLQGLGQAVEVEGELPELVPLQKGKADPVLPSAIRRLPSARSLAVLARRRLAKEAVRRAPRAARGKAARRAAVRVERSPSSRSRLRASPIMPPPIMERAWSMRSTCPR